MQAPSLLRHLIPLVFRDLACRLVVNSKAVGKNLLGLRWQRYTEVVYNAVSDKFFEDADDKKEVRLRMKIPPSGLLIGVPGTLRPVKGHQYFLNAVKLMLSLYPRLHVAICGGGQSDYVNMIMRQANNIEGGERIHFVGWVDDMTTFYRACDICCVPSKAEPFGRVVIEAFACGIPVVATAVGGMVEIVENGKTGYLVPYGDEKALRKKIEKLISDKILRKKIGQAARKQALSRYQESEYQRRLVKIVSTVIKSVSKQNKENLQF